jgi:two-component system cell cycle response regulator DivK
MAKKVLIVEDNELNMKLFNDLLEAHGYQTVGTRNGIDAMDLARQHRPDLISWTFNCRKCPALKSPNG